MRETAGSSKPGPGHRAAVPGVFHELERQARRLELVVFLLAGVIALVPPVVFTAIEIHHLRARTQQHARHWANRIEAVAARGPIDPAALSRELAAGMSTAGLAYLTALGTDGRPVLRIARSTQWLPVQSRERLQASAAPLAEIVVGAEDGPLLGEFARVLAIHSVVGLVLALGVYRTPVRALGRAIRQLEATEMQLMHADKLSAIGEIYAGLTHEINNPLGIVLARVRLLLDDVKAKRLDIDIAHDLETVERSAARIAEIMRGLLTFARKAEFQRVSVDLNRVVSDVVALVEKSFAKQDIRIESALGPNLPRIQGSRDHLQQVLLNLLNNARDAMPQGGRIAIRTKAGRGQVVTEVEDSGTGIAQEARQRLFEPFFTTKEVGKGTGLGLSVSYGIMKAHGGEIEVDSEPGRGALFRLTLPAAPERP